MLSWMTDSELTGPIFLGIRWTLSICQPWFRSPLTEDSTRLPRNKSGGWVCKVGHLLEPILNKFVRLLLIIGSKRRKYVRRLSKAFMGKKSATGPISQFCICDMRTQTSKRCSRWKRPIGEFSKPTNTTPSYMAPGLLIISSLLCLQFQWAHYKGTHQINSHLCSQTPTIFTPLQNCRVSATSRIYHIIFEAWPKSRCPQRPFGIQTQNRWGGLRR